MTQASGFRIVLSLALLAVWAFGQEIESTGNLEVTGATIQRLEDPEVAIRLPFGADARTAATFRVHGTILRAQGKKAGPVHLAADDCIEAVLLAGKPVDLSRFTRQQLCDWHKGIEPFSSSEIPATGAPLEVIMTNISGPYSFDVSGPVETRSFMIQRLAAPSRALRLPLEGRDDPFPAAYRVRGNLHRGFFSHRTARIVADDCLDSLYVRGSAVDLSGFSKERLCDWQQGLTLDLGRYLERGDNSFEAVFRNAAGNYAFQVLPDPDPFSRPARLLQLLAALAFCGLWAAWMPRGNRRLAIVEGLVFAFGAMLRLDFIFSIHPPELHAFSDAGGYLGNAREMAAGIFASHQLFQGVGYPLLMSWTFRLTHGQFWLIHWVQWALAVLSVLLAWRASERLLGRKPAAWALALMSFHFPLISLSGFFMAETVYTIFIAALFYVMAKRPFPWRFPTSFALGAVFMLGHAVKGLNAFFAPISFLWAVVWAWKRGSRDVASLLRKLARPLGGFTAGVLIVAGVQAEYTRSLWGKVVLSAPTGGLNLVEGKCPAKINEDSEGYGWQSPLFAQLGENQKKKWPRPFADQAFFWRAGLQCIIDNPAVLLTSFQYVHYLFADNQLWPPNQTYPKLVRRSGMFFTSLLYPGILLALLLLLRRPFHRGRLPFLLAAAILFGSWALKSEMRYRIPFDVVFIPMAALGWAWLSSKLLPKARQPGLIAYAGVSAALALAVTLSIYVPGAG